MPQLGIPYTLTGPDGTVAVFNSPEDPNFVGYLDSENGITGLLDTAEVRQGVYDKPEFHGAVETNSFFSQRIGTLQGFVIPDPNMTVYNSRESRLKRASRAVKGESPSVLTWTPDGSSQRTMRLFRAGKIALTGRRPKNFVLPMSSPDPFVYSAAIHELTVVPGESSGDKGFSSPLVSPLKTEYNPSAQVFVANAGDAETWPEFIIYGPITNPTIYNNSTGESFTLTYTLAAGEKLYVNTLSRTVLLEAVEGQAKLNRYEAYAKNFSINKWWPLLPGNTSVKLLSAKYSEGAKLVIKWQDAWE